MANPVIERVVDLTNLIIGLIKILLNTPVLLANKTSSPSNIVFKIKLLNSVRADFNWTPQRGKSGYAFTVDRYRFLVARRLEKRKMP
jgi:hypothetical protein